jgi:hypothetical protein
MIGVLCRSPALLLCFPNCAVLNYRIDFNSLTLFKFIEISQGRTIMISANCDIREFISELENKDFFEMIYLLDKEATEAERQLYNPKSEMSEKQICGAEYASNLKNLVFYLRYGARPRGLKQEDLNLLQSVCEKNRI